MRLVEIKLKSLLRPKNRYTNYDFGPKINCRGMIIAPGLVITAKHCTNFPDFLITINDLPAKVLATSQADLAILKVPSFLDCDLPPLNLLLYPSSRIATVRKFPNSGFFWQWGAIKKSGRRDIFHKQ